MIQYLTWGALFALYHQARLGGKDERHITRKQIFRSLTVIPLWPFFVIGLIDFAVNTLDEQLKEQEAKVNE
jgi:hypothetical protein